MRSIFFCMALTSTILSANAADGVVISDVRLSLTAMPLTASTDWDLNSSSGSYDRDADYHRRIGLSYVGSVGTASPIALIWGLGLAYDQAKFSGNDQNWAEDSTQTWQGLIGNGQIGLAFAFNHLLHVEAAGIVGIGVGDVTIDDISYQDIESATATIFEYGLRAGAYATFGKIQVGIETGYISTLYDGESSNVSPGSLSYEDDTTFDGIFFGLSLGMRL